MTLAVEGKDMSRESEVVVFKERLALHCKGVVMVEGEVHWPGERVVEEAFEMHWQAVHPGVSTAEVAQQQEERHRVLEQS